MKRAHRVALVGVVSLALFCMSAAPAFAPPGGGGGSGGGGGGGGSATAASFVDYAQCANGAPPSASKECPDGWINGILQGSNSHYREDEVTPQRLVLEVPAGSPVTSRTVKISYMTRKGSAGAHAYDSLATWNYTQFDADRCQGLGTGNKSKCPMPSASVENPPDCSANDVTPCKFPMSSDPTAVPPITAPASSELTNAHELPQANRQWVMVGGIITAASVPSHDSAGDPATDDFATVTVTYRIPDATPANGLDKTTKVQLLFGGHLAASDGVRGWGPGRGSANISGGPYHIRLDSADGASLGSKDNQIQAAAILAGSPSFTVGKTNNSPSDGVAPGATVRFTVTVTNTGTAPGATSFVDDYDNGITIVAATVPSGCTNNVPSAGTMTCNTSTISNVAPNNTQTFTYDAVMPSTFTGSPPSNTPCSPTQYPVINTVQLLPSGPAASSAVCVNAAPIFTVEKDADPSSTNTNGTVTYDITVRNTGSAPGSTTFTDDYDDRITNISAVTTDPAGGSCSPATVDGTAGFSCSTSVINPGGSQVFTYTAKMPASFTGSSGGNGCSSTQYPVRNVVVLDNGDDDDSIVCVNASPTFTVEKTAGPTPTSTGETVNYTITVTNGGTAPGSITFTDDYDDDITNISAVTVNPQGTPAASCSTGTVNGTAGFNCSTSVINPGGSQTFTYSANMPASFTGSPGGNGCSNSNPSQYPVRNVVVLANGQTDDAVVCVNASPDFSVDKTVVSPTATPPALPTTTPGGTVRYRLEATNNGSASGGGEAVDTYDSRITAISGLPTGCTNNTTTHKVTCTFTNLDPGQSTSWEYNATMPATFNGTSGGSGCPTGTYPVVNSVMITGGDNDSATVCVDADPNLTISKSANGTSTGTGQNITYTITYSNTGTASASGVQVTDTLPTGTAYVSCAGGQSCGTGGTNTVTWNIGTVAAKSGPFSLTLTVTVTTTDACQICNTAKIASPDFNGGNPVSSNQVCLNSTPGPNPAGAHANGDALGARVKLGGLINGGTTDLSTAATSQSGVGGPVVDDDIVLTASVGTILTANVLKTTSASVVTASPAEARSTDVAEVAGLCVLPLAGLCTVSSSTVRAVASAVATGSSASHSDAGSTIENLRIAGVLTPVDLNVPLTVDLNPLVFGFGSYVAINQRQSSVSTPPANESSGGTYAADLTVTMIHVHVTGVLGLQAVDVTVARARAHADFPRTTVCGGVNQQSVSGHAFVAGLFTRLNQLDPLVNVVQGYSDIPASGGADEAHIANLVVPFNGSIATALAADSSSVGTITATQSKADSIAEVVGNQQTPACLLFGPTSCLINATLVHSESHSVATAAGASSNDGGTKFVGLKVAGVAIAGTPNPNTVIPLLGVGFVILNEQFCDNGSRANHTCTGADHSGLTVRALRVVLLPQNILGLDPGVELIIAEAHSDATFVG